jgi:hypothetical protein
LIALVLANASLYYVKEGTFDRESYRKVYLIFLINLHVCITKIKGGEPLKLKNCLVALAIVMIFLYSGVQATFILQTGVTPGGFALDADFETFDGNNTILDGGGGDPVPGPGIPK